MFVVGSAVKYRIISCPVHRSVSVRNLKSYEIFKLVPFFKVFLFCVLREFPCLVFIKNVEIAISIMWWSFSIILVTDFVCAVCSRAFKTYHFFLLNITSVIFCLKLCQTTVNIFSFFFLFKRFTNYRFSLPNFSRLQKKWWPVVTQTRLTKAFRSATSQFRSSRKIKGGAVFKFCTIFYTIVYFLFFELLAVVKN